MQRFRSFTKPRALVPMSGCLWTVIPLVIMIIIYSVIIDPLTNLFQMPADMYQTLHDKLVNLVLYTLQKWRLRANLRCKSYGRLWPQVKILYRAFMKNPSTSSFSVSTSADSLPLCSGKDAKLASSEMGRYRDLAHSDRGGCLSASRNVMSVRR